VKAFFENDVLNLRVDNFATVYGHSGNGIFTEASTNSPLYIGGLPGKIESIAVLLCSVNR
jgi:hypothetical protein